MGTHTGARYTCLFVGYMEWSLLQIPNGLPLPNSPSVTPILALVLVPALMQNSSISSTASNSLPRVHFLYFSSFSASLCPPSQKTNYLLIFTDINLQASTATFYETSSRPVSDKDIVTFCFSASATSALKYLLPSGNVTSPCSG